MAQAVIKFRDATRDDLDTLFTLSALRGVAIGAALALFAPFAAVFYGDPRMTFVFCGVAAVPLLGGLVNPRFYEFERDLDLSKEFFASSANKIVSVVASVAFALIFRNFWAIIVGLCAGGSTQLLLSYVLRPYRPRVTFASFKKVFGFSSWLTGVSIMAAFNNKLDAFILGRAIGAAGTGVYYVGRQLAELPTSEIGGPIARALYPGLAALQGNTERLRQGFLKGVEALGAVALPASIGFAFVAADVSRMLLGAKWDGAADVIATLTPILGAQTLFLASQYFAMALGLTRLVFFRELIFFFLRTPLFIWAAASYGLNGAVWAVAAAGVVHIVLNLALYARAAARPFWEPIWQARRSILATAAMSLVLLAFRELWRPAEAEIRILSEVLLGAAVYGAGLFAFWLAEGKPAGVEQSALALASSVRKRFGGA
jgi:PST family polysaccharide transporter